MEIINCKYYFTQAEIQEIISLYLLPESLSNIAKYFNIKNRNVIKKVLLENNITLRTKEEIKLLNKQKVKETFQKKYGVDNIFQTDYAKWKSKQTKLQRYNDENYRNIEKIKQTCLEKYGTTNGGWIPEAQEKIKATNLKHWGQEYYLGCSDYLEKTKQTCQQKYGVDHPSQTEFFQDQIEQTMLEKYGVRRYAQTIEFHNKSQHKYKFNNEVFDSFPELAFYIYCIDYNLNIKHIPIKIKYYFNNEIHYYFPDFELNGQLIEIKGDHFFNKDGTMQCPFDHAQDALFEAKHQCMLANNIKIYRSKDYQFAIDYFNQKYKKENFKI